MSKHLLAITTAVLTITSCGGGGSSGSETTAAGITPTNTICTNNPAKDSILVGNVATRIKSHLNGNPIYGVVNSRKINDSTPVNIDYMVHPSSNGAAKALVVLLAGGTGSANLSGTVGMAPISSSGNFLVRSAHLFAAQGYNVVTIDQPSDELPAFGVAYDPYRASMRHAVDISTIINSINTTNLPVIISGTSRGTISAVPNYVLGSGIALSSALTSTSSTGTPIGHSNSPYNLQPAYVKGFVNVSWHKGDTCAVTKPVDSLALANTLNNANTTADIISGGFNTPGQTNFCKANTYHGFMGIESCTVQKQTDWMNSVVTNLTNGNSKPIASSGTFNTAIVAGTGTTNINLNSFNGGGSLVSDADVNDTHKYSVPYGTTTLGGNVSISENGVVSYTPPVKAFITAATQDSFVYVVNDYNTTGVTAKGGTANNVITIDLTL